MDLEQLRQKYKSWVASISVSHEGFTQTINDPLNWTPLRKPLSQCRMAILSTGGVYCKAQKPFELDQRDGHQAGDPSYREVPSDTPANQLLAGHFRFNSTDANEDINCLFPIDRVKELARDGVIGGYSRTFFGCFGFVPDPTPVVRETAPAIARKMQSEGVDIALLTPG